MITQFRLNIGSIKYFLRYRRSFLRYILKARFSLRSLDTYQVTLTKNSFRAVEGRDSIKVITNVRTYPLMREPPSCIHADFPFHPWMSNTLSIRSNSCSLIIEMSKASRSDHPNPIGIPITWPDPSWSVSFKLRENFIFYFLKRLFCVIYLLSKLILLLLAPYIKCKPFYHFSHIKLSLQERTVWWNPRKTTHLQCGWRDFRHAFASSHFFTNHFSCVLDFKYKKF